MVSMNSIAMVVHNLNYSHLCIMLLVSTTTATSVYNKIIMRQHNGYDLASPFYQATTFLFLEFVLCSKQILEICRLNAESNEGMKEKKWKLDQALFFYYWIPLLVLQSGYFKGATGLNYESDQILYMPKDSLYTDQDWFFTILEKSPLVAHFLVNSFCVAFPKNIHGEDEHLPSVEAIFVVLGIYISPIFLVLLLEGNHSNFGNTWWLFNGFTPCLIISLWILFAMFSGEGVLQLQTILKKRYATVGKTISDFIYIPTHIAFSTATLCCLLVSCTYMLQQPYFEPLDYNPSPLTVFKRANMALGYFPLTSKAEMSSAILSLQSQFDLLEQKRSIVERYALKLPFLLHNQTDLVVEAVSDLGLSKYDKIAHGRYRYNVSIVLFESSSNESNPLALYKIDYPYVNATINVLETSQQLALTSAYAEGVLFIMMLCSFSMAGIGYFKYSFHDTSVKRVNKKTEVLESRENAQQENPTDIMNHLHTETEMDPQIREFIAQNFVGLEDRKVNIVAVSGTLKKLKSIGSRIKRRSSAKQMHGSVSDHDLVSKEMFDTWDYSAYSYVNEELQSQMVYLIAKTDVIGKGLPLSEKKLVKFIEHVSSGYRTDIPYHTFDHACDVTQFVYRIITTTDIPQILVSIELLALLVAALGHDIKHPGLNNKYLITTQQELAVRYNDFSPLENMHCATLFEILNSFDCNFLDSMSHDQVATMRRSIISAILGTDMENHFHLISGLNNLVDGYAMQTSEASAAAVKPLSETVDNPARVLHLSGNETLGGHRTLLIKTILHVADVGNACRTFPICRTWTSRIMEEFFMQGDQERKAGITISAFFDRHDTNIPQIQFNFCSIVVFPLIEAKLKIFPTLSVLGNHLLQNTENWLNEFKNSVDGETNSRNTTAMESKLEEMQNRLNTLMVSE